MKKSYIPVIVDTAFFFGLAFLLFLSLLIRAVKSPFAFIFAALLSALFSVLVFRFMLKRKKKSEKEKKEKERAELTFFQLALMKKNEITDMLAKAFGKMGTPYKRVGNRFYLTDDNTVIYHAFGVEGASKVDVLRLYNSLKPDETGKILCADANKETEEFSDKFNGKISLIKGEKAYAFLKDLNALPEITFTSIMANKKKLDLKGVINKKRAKNYFVFGLAFSVMSFIVRFKIYYIIFGCAFLILAAAAVVFGKDAAKEKR